MFLGGAVSSYGIVTATQIGPKSFKKAMQTGKGAKDFVSAYTWAISQHKNFERDLAVLNAMVAY